MKSSHFMAQLNDPGQSEALSIETTRFEAKAASPLEYDAWGLHAQMMMPLGIHDAAI